MSKCASFSVSRALREIKTSMLEKGPKCATFAQNYIRGDFHKAIVATAVAT